MVIAATISRDRSGSKLTVSYASLLLYISPALTRKAYDRSCSSTSVIITITWQRPTCSIMLVHVGGVSPAASISSVSKCVARIVYVRLLPPPLLLTATDLLLLLHASSLLHTTVPAEVALLL